MKLEQTNPFEEKAKQICALLPAPTDIDLENVTFWLQYHEMEPSAAAERISSELDLPYQEIYNLL